MSCATNGCPLEKDSFSPGVSPGPIENAELIVRAAYSPMHVGAKGRIKSSLTEPGKLIGEGISVWRASEGFQDPTALQAKLPQRQGQTLEGIYGTSAIHFRDARAPSYDGRLFCVIDDCATDDSGGADPFHAGIRLCSELQAEGITKESALFLEAQEQLRLLLSNKIL